MPRRPNSLSPISASVHARITGAVALVEVGEALDPRRAAPSRPSPSGVSGRELGRELAICSATSARERPEQVFLVGEVEVEGAVRGLRRASRCRRPGPRGSPARRTPRRPASSSRRIVRWPRARSSRPCAGCRPGRAGLGVGSSGPSRQARAEPTLVSPFAASASSAPHAPTPMSALSHPPHRSPFADLDGRRRRAAAGRREPDAHDVRAVRRRVGRLQPDAPRRHDRDPGRQPVGVRPRHALDGARGAGREGLVRAGGDPPAPGALRQAGVAGRRAHVHGGRSPASARRAASTSSTSTSRSRTRTASRSITGSATAAVGS